MLDTKCPPTIDCWFCKDTCVNCMELCAPGFTSTIEDSLSLQFCSKECAEGLSGHEIPLQISAVLVNLLLAEANECDEGVRKLMFSVSAFATGRGKGTKFSLNIYQHVSSNEANSPAQYCAHYSVQQLFSRQYSEFLISSEAEPLAQIIASNSELFTSKSSYFTVEQYLLEAVKVLFKCHEKFMKNSSSDTMTIYLNCPQKIVSQVGSSVECSEIASLLLRSFDSYRIVSKVDADWSSKQVVSLLLCFDSFKKVVSRASYKDTNSVLKSTILLQLELFMGELCLCH